MGLPWAAMGWHGQAFAGGPPVATGDTIDRVDYPWQPYTATPLCVFVPSHLSGIGALALSNPLSPRPLSLPALPTHSPNPLSAASLATSSPPNLV